MLITLSDAAELLGLRSRNSLYRKINSGDLQKVDTPDGPRLESEGLLERWGQITRTAADSPRPPRPPQGHKPRPSSAPPPRRETDDLPDYNVSRARSEYEKANLLELDRKAKEALLLPTEQVEKAWANAVAIARTKLLAIPTRARQRIPHLSLDEVALIEELVRETLEDLSSGE